ncbi:hypothetical protein C499_01400 [Halogeometricum borinquense DSM 11551]|nr:hypothetical protein C499_01400 [Halogeometricum borinquense DSM 11551]
MEVIDYRIIEAVQQEDQAQRVDQISKKVGKSIELTEKRCELLLNKGLLDRDMYKQYEVSDLGRRFMDGLASEKELRN